LAPGPYIGVARASGTLLHSPVLDVTAGLPVVARLIGGGAYWAGRTGHFLALVGRPYLWPAHFFGVDFFGREGRDGEKRVGMGKGGIGREGRVGMGGERRRGEGGRG